MEGGFHLDKNIVGEHLDNYDSILVLSHFKGHAMGGFGGALKNISIGIASTHGKTNIHTAGVTTEAAELFNNLPPQDHFLESMADACKAVISHKGAENMLYINVANRLSVDCDCDSHPAEPEMADLGIFASTDPVAVDQACYDAVVNSPDPGKKALIEVTTDTDHGLMAREPQFYLDASNMLQNISLTKSFSFDIYIEDADARSFLLQKARYYNWSNTPFGTCRRTIPSNQWVTVTFQRENYDTELGGYIFAGSDQSLGGVMWTADDDRFISNFYIVDSAGLSECGGINIYLDNIRVEV